MDVKGNNIEPVEQPSVYEVDTIVDQSQTATCSVVAGNFDLNFSGNGSTNPSRNSLPDVDSFTSIPVAESTTREDPELVQDSVSVHAEDDGRIEDDSFDVRDERVDEIIYSNDSFDIRDQSDQNQDGVTFDVTRGGEQEATIIQENSLREAPVTDTVLEPTETVTYEVIEAGTNRNRPKLVSSHGYSYTIKARKMDGKNTRVQWRCSMRSNRMKCGASVNQSHPRADYRPGAQAYCHPPDHMIAKKVKMTKEVKAKGQDRLFDPANRIVEEALVKIVDNDDFNLKNPSALEKAVNRVRAATRPPEPIDIHFEINRNHIGDPDFLVGDVSVGTERHLIFATQTQLTLLHSSLRWYVDGTFKIRRDPFYQLFSIHAFVKKDDVTKQVPLVFVLMSKRRKEDYVAVLEKVVDLLGGDPAVKGFMMDFESAMWSAARDVFPTASLRGCSFHWAQAVLRKVASLGLKSTYEKREGVHWLIRRVLALPFLPAEHVRRSFEHLRRQATAPELSALFLYIDRQWLNNTAWSEREWSAYRQLIRTNNDVEGWHHRINGKGGRTKLQFYVLVPLLLREA